MTDLTILSLNDMQGMWPRSDEGRLCARLLQRYLFSRMVEQSAGAPISLEAAPFHVGGEKMLAELVRDFAKMEIGPSTAKAPTAMPQGLNLFRTQTQPEKNENKPV